MNTEDKNIIMGLDISTTCIGVCLLEYDGSSPYGKILELTHVSPKVSSKIKGIESLFLKKQIFNDEFLCKWKNKGIKRVIIESPLLRSNNVYTVGTLLQFNGMISDCVYNVLNIVPEYISSYDARKFAFPEFMSIRKYDKKGNIYKQSKILSALNNNNFILFGGYPWDVDKKTIIQSRVAEIFPEINWLINKKGDLKKENFDACDAYVACLGLVKKEKYGELNFEASDIEVSDKCVKYSIKYSDNKEYRTLFFE